MADPTLEQMMKTFLETQQKIAEDQKQTAARQLRLEQRLAAQASLPDLTHVDRDVKQTRKQAKAAAQPPVSDRILRAVKNGPKTVPQLNEMLGYNDQAGKTAIWGALRLLELEDKVVVVSRPGVRGNRGPSVVYHCTHIKLLKPLP